MCTVLCNTHFCPSVFRVKTETKFFRGIDLLRDIGIITYFMELLSDVKLRPSINEFELENLDGIGFKNIFQLYELQSKHILLIITHFYT
jgi:hypothetical protein